MGWWRDREELRTRLEEHGWNAAALARASGAHRTTIAGWAKRHGIELGSPGPKPPGTERPLDPSSEGEIASLIEPDSDELTAERLLKRKGLSTEDHRITSITVNQWDAPAEGGGTVPMGQVKVSVTPRTRAEDLLPAREAGYRPPIRARAFERAVELTYVTSDLHAPYHDEAKHAAQCSLLKAIEPERGIDLGDMLDLPRPSRHRATPGWDAAPQSCIDAAYRVWVDRVAASPSTSWQALLGNHDIRLEVAAREKVAELAGLTRAEGELPVMDLGYLLRFDELGVELVRPEGEYHAARIVVADGLVAQHGTRSAPKGSTGAAKAGEGLTCSLLQGHDHRQGISTLTRLNEHGEPVTLTHVAVGASCKIKGGIGYSPDPAWQNGDAIVVHYPDGGWGVELVRWDGTYLTWRDYRVSSA